MIRYDCLQWLAGRMTDQLVVTSQSGVGSSFICVFPSSQIIREPMVAQR